MPRISGNIVVWYDFRHDPTGAAGNADIYGYDLATGQEFAICTAGGRQWYPDVDGNIVVWEDSRNGNPDIYGKDLSTGQEFAIATGSTSQENPVISGDLVIWQQYVTPEERHEGDVWGCNLANGYIGPVCTAPSNQLGHRRVRGSMG
jgi:beta propeller repeat protein